MHRIVKDSCDFFYYLGERVYTEKYLFKHINLNISMKILKVIIKIRKRLYNFNLVRIKKTHLYQHRHKVKK